MFIFPPFVFRPPSLPPKPTKKRKIGKTGPLVGQPKLFGGSIEEFCEVCVAREYIQYMSNIYFIQFKTRPWTITSKSYW